MATTTPGAAIDAILKKAYPDAACALKHHSPLQLLIATILSAQCTDERVNMVTPGLFEKYPDAQAFAQADPETLEQDIRSTGFYKNKARSIRLCCAALVATHGGQVPGTMEALVALAGVGRKTANVILGNAFGVPGVVVDTHVRRLAQRMGLTTRNDPDKIEQDLMEQIPRKDWTEFSHRMIMHGRRICVARKPRCPECPVNRLCPSADLG